MKQAVCRKSQMMKNENVDQQHEAVQRIKDKFPKAVINDTQLSEKGQKYPKIIFAGLSNLVALKGELLIENYAYLEAYLKANSPHIKEKSHRPKICDCIVFKFNDDVIIGVIELKGRNIDIDKIEGQLGNGKILALKIINDIKSKPPANDNIIVLISSFGYSRIKVSGNRRNKEKPELKVNGCTVLFRGPRVDFSEEIRKRR